MLAFEKGQWPVHISFAYDLINFPFTPSEDRPFQIRFLLIRQNVLVTKEWEKEETLSHLVKKEHLKKLEKCLSAGLSLDFTKKSGTAFTVAGLRVSIVLGGR